MPRSKNQNFDKLGFLFVKRGMKYEAFCIVSKKNLKNTSTVRLNVHKKNCRPLSATVPPSKSSSAGPGNKKKKPDDDDDDDDDDDSSSTENIVVQFSDNEEDNSKETEISVEAMELKVLKDGTLHLPGTSTSLIGDEIENTPVMQVEPSFIRSTPTSTSRVTNTHTPSSRCSIKSKKSGNLRNFLDFLGDNEVVKLNNALAEFVFGCNVPFFIVESNYFREFVRKLRSSYVDKLPGRKTLSTTILDRTYEKCLVDTRNYMGSESVLLIDGWKNSSSNAKTVVCILHNADEEQGFLNAWDLTTETKDGDKLAAIATESVELAETLYNTKVYAVVSDNASPMVKMDKLVKHAIWHSTCNSHTGHLLAKDVTNKTLNENVSLILKKYKHPDLEKLVVDRGDRKMKLPCETRWCSHRDSYQCLLTNLDHMKLIAADPKYKKIKPNVTKLLFDHDFVENVKETVEIYNPICTLINACQSLKCSAADAVELWSNIVLPQKYQKQLKDHRTMACNQYSLTAFFLHPQYDQTKLSNENKSVVNNFLFKHLNGVGIEQWDQFKKKKGIFKLLIEKKNVQDPLVFWRMARTICPDLSELALKLLKIPASIAQLERVFSNWAQIHSPLRNRLTFERSKKLMHIYYTLRLKDKQNFDIEELKLQLELDEEKPA